MKKVYSENLAIASILLLAALLRFWRIWELEYTYDELSAVLRAQHQSFKKLMECGVLPDGHPALVQTFIWLIGDHVTLLKCIAASLGTAAVYFVYRAGKSIFQPSAGLVAALFFAVLYMPVMWSQQIRPYAFGLCFSSAAFWFFAQIYFEKKTQNSRYILFAIFAALCAYTHYFSALFATLLFLLLLFQRQQNKVKVLCCGVLALVLFIPHFSITYAQFRQGGLGWLGKPDSSFLPEHIYELFSKSTLFLGMVGIIALTGVLVLLRNHIALPLQKIVVLLLSFLTPIIVGFLYSHLAAPILQHSVLLFSSLPLFLLLGFAISHVPRLIFLWQCMLIACCGIGVLVWHNQHYSLGYQEPWSSAIKTLNQQSCGRIFVDAPEDVWQYHMHRSHSKFHYFLLPATTNTAKDKLGTLLSDSSLSLVVGSGSNPAMVPVLEDFYSVQKRKSFIGSEVFCFNKSNFKVRPYAVRRQFQSHPITFQIADAGKEIQKNDVIVLRFRPFDFAARGEIQSALKNQETLIDWRSTSIDSSTVLNNGWHYLVLKLADIPGWQLHSTITLKVLQNEKPIPGIFELRVSKGNPYLYGVEK